MLSPDDLKIARQQIEEIAYLKWEKAGCPDDDPLKFWKLAELHWIEYYYVPDREIAESQQEPE